MPRLTQNQLTGFRMGAAPASPPDSGTAPVPRRAPGAHAAPPARHSSTRATPATTAAPGSEDDRASPLGPVPPAPSRTEGRHKIGLTLPLAIAERVRALTGQGYALADLVMVAYQNQRNRLLDEQQVARPRRLVQHPRGRSPLTVALSNAERDALDVLAEHLGWTRSYTVAALLERELESTT